MYNLPLIFLLLHFLGCTETTTTETTTTETIDPIKQNYPPTKEIEPSMPLYPTLDLPTWSQTNQMAIYAAIAQAKMNNPHPFAVFDADNTLWKYDITEALLAWLEKEGLLTIDSLPKEIFPIPPRPSDTLFSYYDHLCNIDHSLGYLFASQAFGGFSLKELQQSLHALLQANEPIPAQMPLDQEKFIMPPIVFPGQKELVHTLQQNGIEVWVVSASPEEVVRMMVSDPKFGLSIPPERVIGVNLMLNKPDGSVTVGALERKEGHTGLDYYLSEERLSWKMSNYPFAPLTWYAGKLAAIQEWIDPSQRPILVAGDSPNDFYMQFYADVAQNGIRLRIHRSESHVLALQQSIERRQLSNANDRASENWITVTVEDLGLPD